MDNFSKSLDLNMENMKKILRLDYNFDILYRTITVGGRQAGFFFIDGFVEEGIMQRLMQFFCGIKEGEFDDIHSFLKIGMPYVETSLYEDMQSATTALLSGVSLMFIDGCGQCIGIDTRTYPARSVSEPWKDRVLKGSRDGFVETLVYNVSLMRRRIRDPLFSAEIFSVGERSKSDVAICYIEDKVDKKILNKVREKIKDIKVEALTMNVQSLAECILAKRWINPLPKFKYSERPDTASAAILDGNIVIVVDNSPAVMILPTSVFDVMEEADDFYFPPLIGTYLRLSRFAITVFGVLITPLWLLFLNNPDWVPQWLSFILISDDITVPVLLQLLLLELAIDGLKLAAVNTPTVLSTPLSVIAGIIVGEFAVESGWFNSESMLYMAFVSVATYSQVSFEMGYALKFMRIFTLILTQIFNVWGFTAGIIVSVLMVVCNKTLSGKSYLYPLIPFDGKMLKRKLFRVRLPHSEEKGSKIS